MTLENDLITFNEQLVEKEQVGGQEAHAFFETRLSDQLVFRRANGKIVGKAEFLASLNTAGPFSSRRSQSISVTQLGERALVTLIVVGRRLDDRTEHHYQNIRLFSQSGDNWIKEFWYNYEITGL